MAYTASAFSFGFCHPETNGSSLFTPIIFTGAQKPISEPGGDGERNIMSAIQAGIQADEQNVTDILIVFGGVIVQAVKACKISDHRYDAFDSVDGVHIGTISSHGAVLHNANLAITSSALHRKQMAATYDSAEPPPNGKFSINIDDEHYRSDGYIADITLHPGVTEKSIEAYIKDKNCLGIIMTSLGAGNIPERIIPALEKAGREYNLPVFSVSPFVGGAVNAHTYEAAEKAYNAGVSFPGDQSSATAWVKMHWLMANGMGMTSKSLILNMQRIFRGEGSLSTEAGNLPPIHNKKPENKSNSYRNRMLLNYTRAEGYRKAKGNHSKSILVPEGQQPVLPRPDPKIQKIG